VGRRLTISWNRGDDPQRVALEFCATNGIPAHEAGDVVAFIHTASSGGSGGGGGGGPAAFEAAPPVSAESKAAMLAQAREPCGARRAARGERDCRVDQRSVKRDTHRACGSPTETFALVASSLPSFARARALPRLRWVGRPFLPFRNVRSYAGAQVMVMGFDEAAARAALEATGWSGVEAAIGRLLG